tara:strand:- start:4 stop:4578 length:4575 start_codon:yes stop_codon:yes gene_type:complete
MADEKFISRGRVKENPSTGTIRGDISKFVINPLKDLFKEKETVAKFVEEGPKKISISKEGVKKVIQNVLGDNTQPDLKDLVRTADLKLKAIENPETAPWVNSLIFATGGTTPDLTNQTKTEIANGLALNDLNIIKVSNTNYIDTSTGNNIYQDIGKNRLTSQAMNGLLEAGYSFGQMVTIPLDLGAKITADKEWGLTQKLDKLYDDMYKGGEFRDPNTTGEAVIKVLTEYGVPFTAASKLMKPLKLLLGGKASKIKNRILRYGTKGALSVGFNGASFGAAEFVVGNKGDTIDAPDFYGLIDNPKIKFEGEEGKTGSELALARLKNKIRFGYEGTKIGATWGLVGRAAPLSLRLGLKTVGKGFTIGTRAANATVVSPVTKILTGQIPGTGTKLFPKKLMYSKTIVPGASRIIATGLRKGGKFAMFQAIQPILRGVKYTGPDDLYSAGKISFKNKGDIPPFDEWKLFSVTNSNPLKARLGKIAGVVNYLTKEFKTPKAIYSIQEQAGLNIKSENRVVNKYLQDIESHAHKLVKAQGKLFNKKAVSPLEIENQVQTMVAYLKNQVNLSKLPKEFRSSAEGLKKILESKKSEMVKLLADGQFKDDLVNMLSSYMRKSFAIVTNPIHNPPKEVITEAVKAMRKIMSKDKGMQEEAILTFKQKGVTNEQALNLFAEANVRNMIVNYKTFAGDPIKYLNDVSKNILKSDKLIVTGEELPKVFRKLLGEEKNARSEVLQTITDLVTNIESKKMYDEIMQVGLKKGFLKRNKGTLDTDLQPVGNLPGMGMLKSEISEMFAGPAMIQALRGSQGLIDSLLKNNVYRGLMQFKTGVQFGKTGLSFDTQMRNVVSTPMFVLGYGWVGGKGTVADSFKFIYDDITGAGKSFNTQTFVERIGKGIKLGYLDESIEAQEMLAVVKKLNENPKMIDRWMMGTLNTKFMDRATQFYQAGDNVWKEYAYRWNRNNLNNIFKGDKKELIKQEELITGAKHNPISKVTGKKKTYDDATDEFAAWYARNLMPTYSLVPEGVRVLRMTPIGSFISWPAEILRLTGVGARTALREASSTNIAIQQNGLRKLMGMTLTLGAGGAVMDKVFERYTGVGKDKIKAFKRSFAYDYDKNSRFTAVKSMENNTLTLINSSYADVWDYLKKPMRAFLNQIGEKDTQVIDKNVWDGIKEAAKEFASPFFTQNLAIEPILDALPAPLMGRGGKTTEGYSVYSQTDSDFTQWYKGIKHIIRTGMPGTILQGKKYADLAYDIYKGKGDPDAAWQKFASTITGRKIQRFDLLKIMNQKAGKMASTIKGDLTLSEGFYRSSDWKTRGPEQIKKEFEQIQEESFIQQQKILQFIRDARTLDIPDYKIADTLKRLKNDELVGSLMYGEKFTPYTYYSSAFEKRYDTALRDSQLNGTTPPNFNYVFPIKELEEVMVNHSNLDLTISYKENMKKIAERKASFENKNVEPNEIEPPKIDSNENILNLLKGKEVKLQTPPLPLQPAPKAIRTVTPPVNQATGLTRSETALLSPDEQAIRLNQRGIA